MANLQGSAFARTFIAQCEAYAREDVARDAMLTIREAAETAAEAVAIGNEFGPGIPRDTSFAAASFRMGLNRPVDGPRLGIPGVDYAPYLKPNLALANRFTLDDRLYFTTVAEYAQYLEELPLQRRAGEYAGRSTAFIAPVEQRWPAIVDDAADRVGFGKR